jgi:hypothetical protein
VLVGITPAVQAWPEARLFDDSMAPQGEEGFDVLSVGNRLDRGA